MHELGHLLGHKHAEESSFMQESPAPGVRRLQLGDFALEDALQSLELRKNGALQLPAVDACHSGNG